MGCTIDKCERDSKGRKLCSFHRSRIARGQPLDGPTRKRPHKLESFNESARTGVCRVCGPTSIVRSTGLPGFKCGTSVFEGVLNSKYKISLEQYNEMLFEQGGVCAICQRQETRVDKRYGAQNRLAVDHDHKCCPGQQSCGNCVRGLLCHSCNTGIGKLQDNYELLLRAAKYVSEGLR